MTRANPIFAVLRDPETAPSLSGPDWNRLIRYGRREFLLGTVGARTAGQPIPDRARIILDEALETNILKQRQIRFEVERVAAALHGTGIPVLLMKGAAYLLADLPPLPGRHIGDLDIMVPEDRLAEAESTLKAAGWRSVKSAGSYDDDYYRQWMHELPPLAHETRGHVVDLHHNILPRTARLTPDSRRMLEQAVPVGNDLYVMGPEDMLLHAAAHLAYDGDFAGGARNLWDIDRLTRYFSKDDGFWQRLLSRAEAQQLSGPLRRALGLASDLYSTPLSPSVQRNVDLIDRLALRKLGYRDRFGDSVTPLSDFLLFCRGHWLRMPPIMLTRHLLTKWQARRREAQG